MTEVTDEEIFRWEGGKPIKFFVQKDLDEETIKDLGDQITANGGRVETKVPIQGFVLIEPKSPEGLRLIDCWDTPERPMRYFVPRTFVAACLEERKLLPQVFRRNGVPLKMHIHPSITNEITIETLRNRIWHSGGNPLTAESEADIIISDEAATGFRALVERYDHFHNKYVESVPWVKQCVESGVYKNTPVTKKNLGGRIVGNKRTEYSAADDTHLVSYIACRLPDATMRGRTGNKLYQDLCSRLDLYPWAERHPWQSWRERYKNNVARFNRLIASYLDQHPVPEDGKGLHGFVRLISAPPKSTQKQPIGVQNQSQAKEDSQGVSLGGGDAEWGSQWDVRVGNKSPPAWGKAKRKADGDRDEAECLNKRHRHQGESDEEHVDQTGVSGAERTVLDTRFPTKSAQLGSASPAKAPTSRTAPDGDLTSHTSKTRSRSPEDNNELIGSAVLDSSLDADSDDGGVGVETQRFLDANRNMLTSSSKIAPQLEAVSPTSVLSREVHKPPGSVMPSPDIYHSGNADLEHALIRIACEYRFLLDEVKEEYEELSHDLDATRSHFKDIRAFINDRKNLRKNPLKSL